MAQTLSAFPITSRLPHSGHTPPTSPLASTHLALLAEAEPSYYRKHHDEVSPTELEPPLGGGQTSGRASNWLSSGPSARARESGRSPVGVERTLGQEEGGEVVEEGKLGTKRTLSDRLGEAGAEMKRRVSGAGGIRDHDDSHKTRRPGRVDEIKRVAEMRLKMATKRGNLPFVIVFAACFIIFVSALAGVGYVPPPDADSVINSAAASFRIGKPIHHALTDDAHGQQVMAARREMEEAWGKKKRPKDGAWMKKQRNDGAVRRKDKTHRKAAKKAADRPAPIAPEIREAAEAEAEAGEESEEI